jgi:diguanylate cyclase (GGDEF)-like protein
MNQTFIGLTLASFLACAGLFWLAAETGAVALSRGGRSAPAVMAVAVLLGACGLWWPTHALRGTDAATDLRGVSMLLPWVPALLLAALACAVGPLWHLGLRHWAVTAAVAMPIVAYVHAMLSEPGLFRHAQASGWLGVGSLTLSLSAALIAGQLRFGDALQGRGVRVSAGLVAAGVACLGSVLSVVPGELAHWSLGPDWLLVLALIAIGVVLRVVLGLPDQPRREPSGRASRRAAVDNLTGLPTRLYFESQLRSAARKCQSGSARLAVLFIDLDGFKPVNDSFGHSSGDRVLEQVGQRLKALARGAAVAARVGGDEFLLLVPGIGAPDAAAQLAQQLIEALAKPYRIEGREVGISCSVGIALYPEKCHPGKLIARADAAMYAAKRAGGSRHCFYTPAMDADVQQNFDMLRDLRQALANDELELFYQPKIDARSGKVTAAEALLRWNHPTRGMVMPGQFLPLAERSGLMGPLGNWVIEASCKQARAWRDKGLRMRVAINLSAHQMRQDDIADRITEALTRHRIHPSLLTCEITESAAMEDTAATQETFRRLGELGAHLSIDDFGTGYSSLSYLRQLPAEELKIDASFVKDVDHSADARAVVDAVVKLAHALGLKVVAEGVESPRQQKVLVELGCDELQGFLFAKPMSARALLLWAMDDRAASAAFRDSLFGETRQASRQGARLGLHQPG